MSQVDYIISDKMLELILKRLKLNISKDDHDYLVCELYRHIDYTRRKAYGIGYKQGRFDKEMELSYEVK